MNAYPSELRTPPLPLVAFVGLPECHKAVGAYFSQILRPPLVSVGVAEANEHVLARLFGPRKNPSLSLGPPQGILKADWLVKHRQRKAAVAVAFAQKTDVEGDPNAWNKLLFQLRIVREATNARAAGFLVVVLQEYGAPDLPHDRITAICQHLNLESKHLLTLTRADPAAPEASQAAHDANLKAIGRAVVEQAVSYYTNETARIKQKLADRTALNGTCPVEISCRTAFKLGVLCEFRQDWGTAVAQYQEAYQHVCDLALRQPLSWQRHAEITRVAEQLQFKICMLLLHQQRLEEALDQFRTHMATYLNPPGPMPPAALSSHLAWVARQYAAAAEMIRPRLQDVSLDQQDCHPAYLQLAAADTAIRRRHAAARAHAAAAAAANTAAAVAMNPAAVKKGAFVGQLLLRLEDGTRPLTESEYLAYLEVEESKVQHSALGLELLNSCLAHFKEARYERMRSYVGVLMAQEHLAVSNLLPAYKLLLQVAHAYRRDGWDAALVSVLMRLCECSKRLKLVREYLSFSVELTALPNPMGGSVNVAVASEGIRSLLTGTSNIKTSIMKKTSDSSRRTTVDEGQEAAPLPSTPPGVASPPQPGFHYVVEHLDLKAAQRRHRDKDGSGSKPGVADLMQKHHQHDSGWWRCLALASGFDTQPADPACVDYCISLLSSIPVKVPVERVEVRMVDELGECGISALPFDSRSPSSPSSSTPVQQLRNAPGTSSTATKSQASSTQGVLQSYKLAEQGESGSGGREELGALHADPPAGAAEERSGLEASSSGSGGGGGSPDARLLDLLAFELLPGKWVELRARVQPRRTGRVKVDQVCIHLSRHGSITYRLSSFPQGQTLPLRLQQQDAWPLRRVPGVVLGQHVYHVQHLGALPQLDIRWPDVCLAGEFVRVEVVVTVQHPLPKAELDLSLKPMEGVGAEGLALQYVSDGVLVNAKCEGERIPVPPISPSSPLHLLLFVRCSQAGRVSLNTTLFCPAPVPRSSTIELLPPFHYTTRFHAESNVHTLAPPPAPSTTTTPTAAPLTIGQPCLVLVSITALHPSPLQLVGAYMEMEPDSGLQVLGDLQRQIASAPGSSMRAGDVATLVLHACPTKVAQAVSMGTLHVRWRRSQQARGRKSRQSWESEGGDSAGSGTPSSPAPPATPTSLPSVAPPEIVDSGLALPVVRVGEGLLSVRVLSPPHATTGIGFQFNLQLHNFTALPQDVAITLMDPQGFAVTGERRQLLSVPQREKVTVGWQLVGQNSGQQPLPPVRVVSVRHNCAVITASAHVHVVPF